MCGIFGIVSDKTIGIKLYQGLKKLEYRGYDSSGIVGLTNSIKYKTIKAIGPIKNLKSKLKQISNVTTGIAHTRWATHGEPLLKNTHPHLSDKIAIVHNGIIENYETLKIFLKNKKYKFKSDTDSEIIAHLIDYHYKKSKDMKSSLIASVKKLEGNYAIGVINNDLPDKLYAACNGSPLIIAKGKNQNFIASDMMALLPVTRKFSFLEEGDVAEGTRL